MKAITIAAWSLLLGDAAALSMRPPQRVPIVYGNSYLATLEQYTVESANKLQQSEEEYHPYTTPVDDSSTSIHNEHHCYYPEDVVDQQPQVQQAAVVEDAMVVVDEPQDNKESLLQKIKDAGIAGVISYGIVQTIFWSASILIVLYGYVAVAGHFPDFSNDEDKAKLAAEAFAYINLVRFTIPFRIGLALSATPWVQSNVIDRFVHAKDTESGKANEGMAPQVFTTTTTTENYQLVIEKEEDPLKEEKDSLLQKIKDAGVAGFVSYGVVQLVFWAASIPVVLFGFLAVAGHLPDFSNDDDKAKLGAEAFAYVNLVRVTVPAQIGVALSATPWVQSNLIDRFGSQKAETRNEYEQP